MAKVGAPSQFPFKQDEIKSKIEDYISKVEAGVYEKADFSHFCGTLRLSAGVVEEVIRRPNKQNTGVAEELKIFLTWLRGQYATSSKWCGPNAIKAIFLLKQNFGDDKAFVDRQDVQTKGDISINVKFGGKSKDPFG